MYFSWLSHHRKELTIWTACTSVPLLRVSNGVTICEFWEERDLSSSLDLVQSSQNALDCSISWRGFAIFSSLIRMVSEVPAATCFLILAHVLLLGGASAALLRAVSRTTLVSRAAFLHQSQELFWVIWVGNRVGPGKYPINLNVQGGSRNTCQLLLSLCPECLDARLGLLSRTC